jgi:hypothetical protein
MISLNPKVYVLMFAFGAHAIAASQGDDSPRNQAEAFRRCNRAFYNQAGNWLDGLSERKGLANGADLEAIRSILDPYLKDQQARVLEIGPGRGRVINWVRHNFPRSEVIAVEQSSANAAYLDSRLRSDSRVSIIHNNVIDVALSKPVDVALWMWSGFAEIAPEEKPSALQNIKTMLNPNGLLIIDLPEEVIGKEVLSTSANGLIDLIEPFGTLRAHLPSEKELVDMTVASGFERVRVVPYRTDTNIRRTSHIFKAK